jgi:molecular chaperone DnaK
MSKILGIDLGSTNSSFSVFEAGEAKIITNSEGARTTPSIVAILQDDQRLVGTIAKRQAVSNPKNTVYTIKRLIGRKFKEVVDYIKLLPYEVVEATNGDCRVKLNGKEYSPEEISAMILAKIKADAEAYLGETITEAVITVPAYFNDSQRASTKAAGEIAGLKVLRIINEPTSAALAYSNGKKLSKKIAVYDFGGSTFDISILDIADGVVEVLATNGDVNLGGDDIDNELIKFIIESFKTDTGLDVSNDTMAIQRIKDEAEKCKIALSTTPTYDINLPFITMDATGPKHLMCTISRAKLEQLAEAIVKRSIEPCKKCLADAGITTVDEVLMVGGMTRMPLIYETAKSIFNVEPNRSINPDESVSLGAAVQGSILTGETNDILLLDVTPLSLGINTEFDHVKVMIERNTTIPCKKTETFVNASDMQSQATIQICQGERPMFNDNKQLGMFNIDITPAPRGMAKIEIEFNIDANGILTVTAKDIATGKSQNITITNSSGLSNEEIEKAKADAEAHAEEDKKRVELMNEKNTAETMCFSIEKTMKDVDNEKINEDERKQLTESIEKVRATIKTSESIDEIKAVTNDLAKLMEPISARLYNANAAQNGQPNMEDIMKNPQFAEMFANMNKQTANTTKPSDDVIDAGQI